MKAINKICQILAVVLALAGIVLFFIPFADIATATETHSLVAAELSFGGMVWRSANILFCFILTIITVVLSAIPLFSAKTTWTRFATPVVGLADAIYLLVIALGNPGNYVDSRPLEAVNVAYTWVPLTLSLVMFGAFAISTAHLFINDYIEVIESKSKRTLLRRFIQFLRDYKSEVKKIVWPSLRDVVKNTLIVLILSALVGAFIWLVDWGLGALMQYISSIA